MLQKKVPHVDKDYLTDYVHDAKHQKLNDKARRQKKEKRIRDESSANTISNLISLKEQKTLLASDPTKSALAHNLQKTKLTVNNLQSLKNQSLPLTNRSNNKLDLLKKSHNKLNTLELDQLALRRLANQNRRLNINQRQSGINKHDLTDSQLLLGQNENLNSPNSTQIDGNNNKKLQSTANHSQDLAAALIQKDHTRAQSTGLLSIFSELKSYEDELRANKIDNLDSILSETKNRFSTSSDKDGYWYFKRKEGCKYLPQNGPIFKNEVVEEPTFISRQQPAPPPPQPSLNISDQPTEHPLAPPPPPQPPSIITNRKPKKTSRKDRLRELQQFYYGYAITKHNRHLGLVRRRLGRNGR